MADVDEQGRPEPPLAADEAATLQGFLDFQRATLAWKCEGLDAVGLARTVAASSMTLGGILKHLAYVESSWCSEWLRGQEPVPPWDTVDWKADPDWEWHSAGKDAPDQLFALWQAAVDRSRSLVTEALTHGDLGQPARRTWPDGRAPSLRWILCHLIEEYARHNGHADLLREAVDGAPASSPMPIFNQPGAPAQTSRVTVTFSNWSDGGTELRFIQENFVDQVTASSHAQDWNGRLDRLPTCLAG